MKYTEGENNNNNINCNNNNVVKMVATELEIRKFLDISGSDSDVEEILQVIHVQVMF